MNGGLCPHPIINVIARRAIEPDVAIPLSLILFDVRETATPLCGIATVASSLAMT